MAQMDCAFGAMSTFILDSLSFRVLGQCAGTPTLMDLIYSVTDFPEFLPTQLKNGMTVNPDVQIRWGTTSPGYRGEP